jgi:uncharacterized OB-fold protein
MTPLSRGIVYTETVIHSAPAAFIDEAPYQLAIVEFDDGSRITARVDGERTAIGDAVEFLEYRNEIPFFRKSR